MSATLPPQLHSGPVSPSKLAQITAIRLFAEKHKIKFSEDKEMLRILKE